MNEILVEEFRKDKSKIIIMIKHIDSKILTNLKCFKNMEDVTIIEAKKINLIKIQKSFFLNLSNLNILDLRENKLEKFPKNITLLKNLKILKLDNNNIGFIPSFINDLEKLEILTLNHNKIKYFPLQFKNLQNLKELKITHNLIENIPIEFGLLKSLEILHFEGNYFTKIPTTLCYLKHLSELSFEWLEFLDPPFQKVIKDNLGRTIINLIRNSLQEMIKKNILFCTFLEFIDRNSNNNTNFNNSNANSLFENNGLNLNLIPEALNNLNNVEIKKETLMYKENINFYKILDECSINNKEDYFKEEDECFRRQKNGTLINLNENNIDERNENKDYYKNFKIENIEEKKEMENFINEQIENNKNNIFNGEIEGQLRIMKKVNSIKDKFSGTNTISENRILNFITQQNQRIFYAIDNNYYGVIKALETNYDEIIKIKNIDNKTPLYYCIHNNKIDIANLFITKIDFSKIPNAYVYLHKAIRIRDPNLVAKLLEIGINTKDSDDQGLY